MRACVPEIPIVLTHMQIQDITSFLPLDISAALAERGEILEALVVRHSHESDAVFSQAASILRQGRQELGIVSLGSFTLRQSKAQLPSFNSGVCHSQFQKHYGMDEKLQASSQFRSS